MGRKKIIITGTIFSFVLLAIIMTTYKRSLSKNATINSFDRKQNIHKQEKENTSSGKYSFEVRVDLDKRVVIPDPATTNGQISVSLIRDIENMWKAKSEKEYSNYLADLSFAGFDKPVFVSSYITGNMTEKSDAVSLISKKTKNGIKKQEVSGNCLALFVTTGMDTLKKFKKEYWPWAKCYFVIIDYKNGVCYKKLTGFTLPYLSTWLDLSVVDLTGDGVQELAVCHCYNKSDDFGIYHADADTHKIKEIYSSFTDFENRGEFIDRQAFKGELLDNYKVALKVPCIGYSKTVSMIKDCGYKKKELHKKRYKMGNINFTGMWHKNGKLRKKWAKEHGRVFLDTLQGVSYVKTKDGTMQVELFRYVCVGHRSESIGNIRTYLEYDNSLDALVIKNAKYSNE